MSKRVLKSEGDVKRGTFLNSLGVEPATVILEQAIHEKYLHVKKGGTFVKEYAEGLPFYRNSTA